MPFIEAYIFKGYDANTRTRLSNGLNDALRMVIPAPPESVSVLVHEMERDNYMRGGAYRRPLDAHPDPRDLVRRFNAAMMSGDFEAADTMVTEDCIFRMPGGLTRSRPHEAAMTTADQWEEFKMDILGVDICAGPEGPVVYERVETIGTVKGTGAHENHRAVIRFAFRGPLICEFEVLINAAIAPPEKP